MAFFEQLGKRLSDASQNVAQQTKNLADVSQLNSANSEKEKQIKRLIFELGKAYYEAHKKDFDAEGVEIIGEINTLYREIHDNHEKIKQIKGIVKCNNCGADVPVGATFCNGCGTKVERPTADEASASGQRFCPSCDAVVPEGNLFCTKCGTRL